jgi:alpha-galactosidase
MHVPGRTPPTKRFQHVLDITHPQAWKYLFDAMSVLIDEYRIDYIKWDHNRVLIDAAHFGRAAVREQTLAFYRLIAALHERFPNLQIESCASGGGRIDLATALSCDRFWTSDCNDPLERASIQRWTTMAIPPEMCGSHIGAPKSHTTGRTQSLNFRAATALFGHAGIEWDITSASADDRELLAGWAVFYKQVRPLLHGGRTVRLAGPDPSSQVDGVVSDDQSQGLFCFLQLTSHVASKPGNVVLAGLNPAATYAVNACNPAGEPETTETSWPSWVDGARMSGRFLMSAGLRMPRLRPENALFIAVRQI